MTVGKQARLINMENFELFESFELNVNIIQIGLDPKKKNIFIITTKGISDDFSKKKRRRGAK